MNFLIKHAGAATLAAFVPPALYFLASSVTPVASTVVTPPIPTPTNTISTTPSYTPSPSITNTPTSKPSVSPTPKTAPPTNTPTSTPSPTLMPSSTQSPVTGTQLDAWFTKYSSQYSIDRQQLWKIAVCESGLNPNAKNGDYGGLYQFASGTWVSTRNAMNSDTNPDIRFNAEEAIKTASFRISTVGATAWPNCL